VRKKTFDKMAGEILTKVRYANYFYHKENESYSIGGTGFEVRYNSFMEKGERLSFNFDQNHAFIYKIVKKYQRPWYKLK